MPPSTDNRRLAVYIQCPTYDDFIRQRPKPLTGEWSQVSIHFRSYRSKQLKRGITLTHQQAYEHTRSTALGSASVTTSLTPIPTPALLPTKRQKRQKTPPPPVTQSAQVSPSSSPSHSNFFPALFFPGEPSISNDEEAGTDVKDDEMWDWSPVHFGIEARYAAPYQIPFVESVVSPPIPTPTSLRGWRASLLDLLIKHHNTPICNIGIILPAGWDKALLISSLSAQRMLTVLMIRHQSAPLAFDIYHDLYTNFESILSFARSTSEVQSVVPSRRIGSELLAG